MGEYRTAGQRTQDSSQQKDKDHKQDRTEIQHHSKRFQDGAYRFETSKR